MRIDIREIMLGITDFGPPRTISDVARTTPHLHPVPFIVDFFP